MSFDFVLLEPVRSAEPHGFGHGGVDDVEAFCGVAVASMADFGQFFL
jgi:hypothetical protein